MSFLQCNFSSAELGSAVTMNVLLPDPPADSPAPRRYPVLYLLHGRSDDYSIWMRRTSIERYVAGRGLIVIMPDANLSWYHDLPRGPRYNAFFREELPRLVAHWFPVSERREDTFVAGLSMGGYGAFLLALSQPERFGAAASLSGALDFADVPADSGRSHGPDADLFALSEKAAAAGNAPALFASCGVDDFLIQHNRDFSAHAQRIGLPLTYEEHPGAHTWEYWDQHIQRVLDWLPREGGH